MGSTVRQGFSIAHAALTGMWKATKHQARGPRCCRIELAWAARSAPNALFWAKRKPVGERSISIAALAFLLLFLGCSHTCAKPPLPGSFEIIPVQEVLGALIQRPVADRIASGQILSQQGLTRFENQYGVKVEDGPYDFSRESLVFGVTDQIHHRAVQLVDPPMGRPFLDYLPTGIKYKLAKPRPGMDHHYLQVFRIPGKLSSICIDVRDILIETATERHE